MARPERVERSAGWRNVFKLSFWEWLGFAPHWLQRFHLHATLGQRRKAIYPFAAFELRKRLPSELLVKDLSTAPADAHV
jgi:hypothetical protein